MQENAKGGIISRIGHWWISYAGTLALAFRGIGRDSIPIMASGMVYSTLTAIIPCLTFLFAFLSAFGVLQPFKDLLSMIAVDTFGASAGYELMSYLEQFSSNALSLGVIGLISFIFTGILLVNKIYISINRIFRTKASSGTVRRFTTFLTFLILGAFIVVAVFAIQSRVGTTLRNIAIGTEGGSSLLYTAIIFLVGWVFLFILYEAVPNARIHHLADGRNRCLQHRIIRDGELLRHLWLACICFPPPSISLHHMVHGILLGRTRVRASVPPR